MVRNESEILNDLENLVSQDGFIETLSAISMKDNIISFENEIDSSTFNMFYSQNRVIKTELSMLLALFCKFNNDFYIPRDETSFLENQYKEVLKLIQELQKSFLNDANYEDSYNASSIRESIFYSGESAYPMQYLDMALLRYKYDSDWLLNNKGFTTEDAVEIINCIILVTESKLNGKISRFLYNNYVDVLTFSIFELKSNCNVPEGRIKSFLNLFSKNDGLDSYKSPDDYNPKSSYPLIKRSEEKFFLLNFLSLTESFYESPFFWFLEDRSYRSKASIHRGQFTEKFSSQRLKEVFGNENVYQNVDIFDQYNQKAGEVDVLITFGDRAIVLQAKSKKLTIPARKGNEDSVKKDFKLAVQDAYDQAFSCAKLIQDSSYELRINNNVVKVPDTFSQIFPVCVVSDHYPALFHQSRRFLEFHKDDVISAPFVLDLFCLDFACEFLESPLFFLSYIDRRTSFNDNLLSSNEITILSYHLKSNLWLNEENALFFLGDDLNSEFDAAFYARRYSLPGNITPKGILTKFKTGVAGKLISQIENNKSPILINLGFLLLKFDEDTFFELTQGIEALIHRYNFDGKLHDINIYFSHMNIGLTIHCDKPKPSNVDLLRNHVTKRKYKSESDHWIGILVNPITELIEFSCEVKFPWFYDAEAEKLTNHMMSNSDLGKGHFNLKTVVKKEKLGRNAPCHCNSGKKYKKCCYVK